MSLFGAMRTSLSGMNGQSVKLGAVSDNISNSGTTGYKRELTDFSSLLGTQATTDFASGGELTNIRYAVYEQGSLQTTSSKTDLAVSGSGFMVVCNNDGTQFLTRSGSFVPDQNGNLVNVAGFYLMGQNLSPTNPTNISGASSLQRVNINQTALSAEPSTQANITCNMPSTASIIAAADLPSANAATAKYTAVNSLVAYDDLGTPVTLDIYLSKTAANTWEATVYNHADASNTGGFAYANPALATQSLAFDPTTGATTGATPLSLTIPGGQTLSLDLSKSTQLASAFSVQQSSIDGRAPSAIDHIEINEAGTLSSVYKNGAKSDFYRIPLAKVSSPTNLTPLDGNIYGANFRSGDVLIGQANANGFGSLKSSALEQSTVDLGAELTDMIQTQRSYTADTKVFQASADLLDVLNNLKV